MIILYINRIWIHSENESSLLSECFNPFFSHLEVVYVTALEFLASKDK